MFESTDIAGFGTAQPVDSPSVLALHTDASADTADNSGEKLLARTAQESLHTLVRSVQTMLVGLIRTHCMVLLENKRSALEEKFGGARLDVATTVEKIIQELMASITQRAITIVKRGCGSNIELKQEDYMDYVTGAKSKLDLLMDDVG